MEAPRNMVLIAVAVIAAECLPRSGSARGRGGIVGEDCWLARKGQGSGGKEDDQVIDGKHDGCVGSK